MNAAGLYIFAISLTILMFHPSAYGDELQELKKELQILEKKIEILEEEQEKQKKTLLEVKTHDAMDNIKFGADLRCAFDYVDYSSNKRRNEDNTLLSNRLILTMGAKPLESLFFKGALSVNKIYGGNSIMEPSQNFDWFGTVTPDDGTVRLREAYFVYTGAFHEKVPFSASVGRRPSLNGFPSNLRDDDDPASPLSHAVNMEFDGASFKIDLEKTTDIDGMFLKFCYGRGFSETAGKVMQDERQSGYYYSKDNEDYTNLDIVGAYLEIINDGQYRLSTSFLRGFHVPGLKDLSDYSKGFKDVGDIDLFALTGAIDGFGFDSGKFLENSIVFASFALSRTYPLGDEKMLGSSESETGYAFYTGVQFPLLLTKGGKLGLEYNYGSKYWRSFTYGEDTITGSKAAARGNAYEIYIIQPIVGEYLTLVTRFTRIDYNYSGSDMFAGDSGIPVKIANSDNEYLKSSNNFRLYLRYRF